MIGCLRAIFFWLCCAGALIAEVELSTEQLKAQRKVVEGQLAGAGYTKWKKVSNMLVEQMLIRSKMKLSISTLEGRYGRLKLDYLISKQAQKKRLEKLALEGDPKAEKLATEYGQLNAVVEDTLEELDAKLAGRKLVLVRSEKLVAKLDAEEKKRREAVLLKQEHVDTLVKQLQKLEQKLRVLEKAE